MSAPLIAPKTLQDRLEPGERLIWWDRPKRGFLLRRTDFFLVPFSVLWCAFAIFWEYLVTKDGKAPTFFMLWGIPFVLVGIYFVFGRFLYDAWRRSRLVYGLTQERVLLATPKSCRSLMLDGIGEMNLEEFRRGEGSIAFGREPPLWRGEDGGWAGWSGTPTVPTLERIPEARRVFTAIRDAQKKAAPQK